LKSYVAQLEDQVKNLKGDLQTSEREAVNARKRVETEKFKTQLGDVLQQSKVKQAGKTLQLTQAIDNIKSENEGNNK